MKITGYESEWMILKELGRRIKQHRIALDITQSNLAKISGISISTEIRIENGDDSKMSNYIKIMTALGIIDNIDFLFQMSSRILKRFLKRDLQEKGRVQAARNKKAPGYGEKINSEENNV